jgi:hypothetical protein
VVPIDAEAFGFWLKAAFGDPERVNDFETVAFGL